MKRIIMMFILMPLMALATGKLYMVIDLSGGSEATTYPVSYLADVPTGGWTDEQKTTKLVLRRIEPGTFMMNGEYETTITLPYYIGVFEVTQRQWELVMGDRPSYFKNDAYYASRPVEHVSYETIRGSDDGAQWPTSAQVDAKSFLGVIRSKTGMAIDLPTEAQWEYACRAGTDTDYNSGVDWNGKDVDENLDLLARYGAHGFHVGRSEYGGVDEGTSTVGSFEPNAWGLYDMHGNVHERCLDWYGELQGGADPKGCTTGTHRVVRGGSWYSMAGSCCVGNRGGLEPHYTDGSFSDFGLRIVTSVQQQESDGLVVWYKFDGDINDSSGNGHSLRAEKEPSYTMDRDGNDNGAVKLDNNTFIYDRVDPQSGKSYSCLHLTNNWSITCWFKASEDTILNDEKTSGIYGANSGIKYLYCCYLAVGKNGINCYEHDSYWLPATLRYDADFGELWHHLALIVDESGDAYNLYVDGQFVRKGLSSGKDKILAVVGSYDEGRGRFTGIGQNSYGSHFNGLLDDFRIYECALSAAEVKSLYNAGGDPIVSRTVTFDGNGGVASAASRSVKNGAAVGELPTATRAGYDFVGWFTAAVGGTEVTATTVVDSDVTYFAQWRKVCVVIAGAANSVDVGLKGKGYATKALPRGLSYSDKTGMVTGICKTVTDEDGVMVTFAKKGAADVVVRFVVREEDAPSVGCALFESGEFTAGVLGAVGGIPLDLDAESGVKSLTMKGQPSGWKLVQDKTTKEWTIEGAATKAGTFNVTLTLTTAAGTKVEKKYAITVAPPHEMAVGTFNGFVTRRSIFDMDYEKTFGAIQVTATDAGKITAKITAAAKTYSFSASSWDAITASGYEVSMSLKSGETLSLVIDPSAGWSDHQLTGCFAYAVMPSDGTAYEVVAQRNAFGKQWYFLAEGDEAEGWTLSYASSAKEANLTVTLNADGKTSVAGSLVGRYTTLKVSASGYCDISEHSIGNMIADFAPIVTVNRAKKVLSIRTNLWFDRKNNHDKIGSAELVD